MCSSIEAAMHLHSRRRFILKCHTGSYCPGFVLLVWQWCEGETPPSLPSELLLLLHRSWKSLLLPSPAFFDGEGVHAAVKSQWCHFRMWESGARWAGFCGWVVSPLHDQRCLHRRAERRKMVIATGLCPSPPAQISGYGALICLDPKINLYRHHAKGEKIRRVAFLGQVTLTTCPKGELDGHCAKVPLQHEQRDALDAASSSCHLDFSVGNRFILSDSEQD